MTLISKHTEEVLDGDDNFLVSSGELFFSAVSGVLAVTVKQEDVAGRSITESTVYVSKEELSRVMTPVVDWLAAQLPGSAPETFIELTPPQSIPLNQAWFYEQTRIRHEREEWSGGIERDIKNRDEQIALAVVLGVPEAQAKKFVFTPVSETESATPEEE